MDRYFRIRVPFGTKPYLYKKDSGLIISGDAYFVYDTKIKKIVHEYIHLHKANYRLTDKAMIKPTAYYKNKKVRNFRDLFLDKFNIVEPSKIHNTMHKQLTLEQIKIINEYFKNMKTTIKRQFSLLSGSNISGAELNHQNSPILCNDNEYINCNFANPIAKFYAVKKDKVIVDDENLKTYRLVEVIKNNLIEGFQEVFLNYNRHIEYELIMPEILEEDFSERTYKKFMKIQKDFSPQPYQALFIESFLNKTIDNYEELINNNNEKLAARLRSFHASNIRRYIKENFMPLHSTTIKANLKSIVNAHIISVSSLLKQKTPESFTKIIDPYNCLRIDQSYHIMWDQFEIFFDDKGNLYSKNGKLLKENYLDMESMPKHTREYFEEHLKARH